MTLSIVTHLRQPASLPFKEFWNAHGDEHSPKQQPIILAACGDLEAALYNGEFEVICVTTDQGEVSRVIKRLMERARYCHELELHHAQEDREPVEPILARAAQLQTVNLVVLDSLQVEAGDVLASVPLALRSHGAAC